MISLKNNYYLSIAAKNHSKFIVKNNFSPSHYEVKSYPYFTGVSPSDRAIYAGYLSRDVIENFSAGDENYIQSINSLFSAIYHRFGFLDFSIDEIGMGKSEDGRYLYKKVFVYDMGNSLMNSLCKRDFEIRGYYYTNVCKDKEKKIPLNEFKEANNKILSKNPKYVIWPYDEATNIPPVFYDEIPDPLPNYSVSGYPISIQFNPYYYNPKNIKLIKFELRNEEGNLVDTLYIDRYTDINNKFPKMAYALFPKERLEWNSRYWVKAVFKIDNNIKEIFWSFKTKKLKYPYYEVKKNILKLKPSITYALYFKPRNRNDILDGYSFIYPEDVKIKSGYIDKNTLYIKLEGEVGKRVYLKFKDGRKYTLIISNSDKAIYP